MATLQERAERELNAILAQYAAGEAEVVRVYFEQEHTLEEHLDMLCRCMGREFVGVFWLQRAARWSAEIERSVTRHTLLDLMHQDTDELSHYVALADLTEWVLGRPLTREEATQYAVYPHYDPELPLTEQYNPRLPE